MTRSARLARVALLTIASGLALPMLAAGQFGAVSGPILGYLADGGGVRPIRGVVGSATIGAPVPLDSAATAVFALDARHFLVSTDTGLLAIDLSTNVPHSVPVDNAPPAPSSIVASAHGTSAALYYADGQRIVIVSGLPAHPVVSHIVDVPATMTVKQLATNDAGDVVLFAAGDDMNDVIYAWTPTLSSSPRVVASALSVTAMVIASSGDAVVADGAANEVFWIRNLGDGAFQQHLAGSAEGLASPNGLALTNDGELFVTNAGTSLLVHVSAEGQVLNSLSCSCAPAGVYAFDNATYRLTDRANHIVYLLYISNGNGHVVFVPQLPAE